jgi:hypothetical protein
MNARQRDMLQRPEWLPMVSVRGGLHIHLRLR